MKHLIACACLLLPALGLACDYQDKRKCRQQIVELLSLRSQAIEGAFGDISFAASEPLQVKFVSSKDPEREWVRGSIYYDAERKLLLIPRSVVNMKTPNPLRIAAYYWPFYRSEQNRIAFPVIEIIDDALWSVFLQESARGQGQTWPGSNCHAADIHKRLPCRMLLSAAARFVKVRSDLFFNENRIDRIWPEDVSEFDKHNYSAKDAPYADVLRLGGILLMRPLIGEFGVPRVLSYVARTPLLIEGNNLRASALRYQESARAALSARTDIAPGAPD